jgi:hypothetical protein
MDPTKATSPNPLSLPGAEGAPGYPIEVTAAHIRALQAVPLPQGWRLHLFHFPAWEITFQNKWAHTTAALLQQEGLLADLFWWQQTVPDTRKGREQDILRLCRNSVVFMLHVPIQGSLGSYHMGGLGILNDIIPGVKAQITVWYPRVLTTHAQRLQVSQAVLRWCLTDFGLHAVWAQTINPRAAQHFVACGAKLMAAVPDYAWYDGRHHEVFLLRLTDVDLPQEAPHGR